MPCFKSLAVLALTTGFVTISSAQASGTGSTTRYWDCCKGSCSWPGKASVSSPVATCNINDQPISDANEASGCDGGNAFMCSDQSPWAVNGTFAYGFAAVSIPGGSESSWCCACYELTFTSTSIAGKKMIVQATNTGGDLSEGQFDLAIPGGGVGLFNGCTDEWGAPSSGWGAQYGGVSDASACNSFPSALKPGCNFRFDDFFEGADNPTVEYKQVTCPAVLTDKTGCVRDGEGSSGGSGSSAVPSAAPSSAAAPVASSAPAESSSIAPPVASSTPAELSSSAAPVESSAPVGPSSFAAPPPSSAVSSAILGSMSIPYLPSSASQAIPVSSEAEPAPSCEVEYVYV